jgi:N-acetylmuramoyl-L-alanine amidase
VDCQKLGPQVRAREDFRVRICPLVVALGVCTLAHGGAVADPVPDATDPIWVQADPRREPASTTIAPGPTRIAPAASDRTITPLDPPAASDPTIAPDPTRIAPPAAAAPASGRPAKRPLVVLDPGHGGSNLGAQGSVPDLREKQLTLILANLVAGHLRDHGLDVQLTRNSDKTLTLRQRVDTANKLAADAFVSIHANASATRAMRGFETFVLTARGVDVDGRALRGSEPITPRPRLDREIALVLDDVERGASQWESAELAARIQQALRARRGKDFDRGVRQDAHHVLLGATMPAVLVEVGFIDHPIEGKQLAEPTVQAQLAEAIALAIEEQLVD